MSTTIPEMQQTTPEARQRLAVASGAALLVAGLILVMFILPAEFAVDPLGTGARVGLLDLGVTGQQVAALEEGAAAAGAGEATILVPQQSGFQQETVDFTVAPGDGLEYKYRLDQGEALLYSWEATAPVHVEFHAEPDGGPRGYAQTYELVQAQSGSSGTLTAPFSGIHGWYWENTGSEPVTVTLTTAGYYNLSHEFRTGEPVRNKTYQ
jgi:hypothetical protein